MNTIPEGGIPMGEIQPVHPDASNEHSDPDSQFVTGWGTRYWRQDGTPVLAKESNDLGIRDDGYVCDMKTDLPVIAKPAERQENER